MKPLVCVRHQETAPLGIIEGVLDEENVQWRYLDCWSDPEMPRPDEVSGLIVLGGEMNADDSAHYPYLLPLREMVRSAVDSDLPFLGICLGAQVLARALSAQVYPAPVREIGFVDLAATEKGETR